MLAQHAHRSLDAAAARTMARIRNDQAKVNGRLRPLLEHIEQHLFDPGLDVNQLKRRCGVRDNSIPIQFHAQLGQPPHAYIESCRLETACRLLRDTDLKVWQIANLLGYSSIQVFSRAFTRWAKQRPTSYRLQERRKRSGVPVATKAQAAIAAAPKQADTISLERALDGELDANQADRLIRRLLQLYPANGILMRRHRARNEGPAPLTTVAVAAEAQPFRDIPTPPPAEPDYSDVLSLEVIEQARAEALWEQIKDLSAEEMRAALLRAPRYESSALFETLRLGALKQGRSDRQRGIEVAKLLLDLASLDTNVSESERQNTLAHAWVWVGNAKRLSQDLAGAEVALETANATLPAEGRSPEVEGNLIRIRADLRMYQRRYQDAIQEITKAIGLLDEAGLQLGVAQALNQRATYYSEIGSCAESIDDVNRAIEKLGNAEEPHTRFVALNLLARNYAVLGKTGEALKLLQEARLAPDAAEDTEYRLKLLWLEAEIAVSGRDLQRAEELYSSLISEFAEHGRPNDAAFAAIDLAATYWAEGLTSKVAALLGTLIPALRKLNMAADALAALALLRQAVEASGLTKALIEKARSQLKNSTL